MNEITASIALIVVLLALLAGGVWVGLTLAGVAWFGMEFFTARAAGDAMAMTIWGSASSWTPRSVPGNPFSPRSLAICASSAAVKNSGTAAGMEGASWFIVLP